MSKNKKIFWCSKCLSMSTRPRISYDKDKVCNACKWTEKKKKINWKKRKIELESLLSKYRKKNGQFDCLVPVSGGKDGSYVIYNLQRKYNMNPLAVTINPPLRLELGKKNLENFSKSGFTLTSLDLDYNTMRELNKIGFKKLGMPYWGWNTAITTAPIRMAISKNIKLIFYGEDGEVEYGGSKETENQAIFSVNYQKEVYMEGAYKSIINKKFKNKKTSYFFSYPENNKILSDIKLTHWSYFENWDPYRNYLIAKKYCGLQENDENNLGTFTNFAQNDQALYSLHAYLMYLKFGFGRANQDACIEIRRGAMDRQQAINLVNLYDGQYPEQFIKIYLEYFKMSKKNFDLTIDKFANKKLFNKIKGRWKPTFKIK
tara:strand:- start:35 stop:1153 length:1119 start_codon:yes stop_codon:yes gene_type:complete